MDPWLVRCEEAPTSGAPEVNGNHLSTLNGLQNTPKIIYNDDVALLVNLKSGVDEEPIFFIFLKEKAFSNILNKKLMRNNKVENEH